MSPKDNFYLNRNIKPSYLHGKVASLERRKIAVDLPEPLHGLMVMHMHINTCRKGSAGYYQCSARLLWARFWPWQRMKVREYERDKNRKKARGEAVLLSFWGWYLWHRREKSMGILLISIWIEFQQAEKTDTEFRTVVSEIIALDVMVKANLCNKWRAKYFRDLGKIMIIAKKYYHCIL